MLCYYNHLYEVSAGYSRIESELVDFKNNGIAGNSSVAKAVTDNFGNLYLVTINDGIKKIIKNSYPVKYFGTAEQAGNYIISVYADKTSNNILAGTYGNGLLIFDSLQHLKKHFKNLPGSTGTFSVNAITANAAGDYIFLAHQQQQAYLLKKDLSSIQPLIIKRGDSKEVTEPAYFGSLLLATPATTILQAQGDLFIINKKTNEVYQKTISRETAYAGLMFKQYLVIHADDTLRFLNNVNFALLKKIAFPNTGGVRCYAANGEYIYLGSNKGIFKIDISGKIIQEYNKANGLPDECIYAMCFDEANNLWCSTNKGILKISAKGSIRQLTKDDGLQENEFNSNAVYKTSDGELFFGGINGLNSFYPNQVPNHMVDVTIYLNQVKVNNAPYKADTATWNIKKMVLPYDQNALSFEFVASGPQNSGQYIHQYKMEGVDKEWIQNNGMQPARYVLPPGSYVFKMYASSFFDKNAIALKELLIVIKPPFYRTWWFMLIMSGIVISLVVYFVNSYNRIRYRKRMSILITERKVQQEKERISMELHDSIGAYANAVLYNTELLEAEKEEPEKKRLMKDLRFVSKDIITALRETIWALKADNYTAQDCLMRIRNFVHPFSRYYPAITFKMEGDAPADMHLHYGSALNIVRIVQESVNNAIKHSQPTHIYISSETVKDKWKLTISDDGKGFDINEKKEGNGLVNMKKRAEELGFYLNIISAINKGTTITIEV